MFENSLENTDEPVENSVFEPNPGFRAAPMWIFVVIVLVACQAEWMS
jgi:hypothetical protein